MHYGLIYGIGDDFLEAHITLTVQDGNGVVENVDFVIDTGLTEDVSLPSDIIVRLNLPRNGDIIDIALADGSTGKFDLYTAYVLWHDRLVEVEVINMESVPLIGMELLRDSNISIDAIPGGAVTIAELAAA